MSGELTGGNDELAGGKIAEVLGATPGGQWGLFDCKGGCALCRAALAAAAAGVRVFASAGNEAGKTYCPAKAALPHPDSGVFAVTTTDMNGHLLGKGTVEFDKPQTFFRPLEE